MQRNDDDVDCDDDGDFDSRQCRRQEGAPGYMCFCARPEDGREEMGTRMMVADERDFSRRDCIRRSKLISWFSLMHHPMYLPVITSMLKYFQVSIPTSYYEHIIVFSEEACS